MLGHLSPSLSIEIMTLRYSKAIGALWYFQIEALQRRTDWEITAQQFHCEKELKHEQMRFLNVLLLSLSAASFDAMEIIFAKGRLADSV